MTTTKPFVIDQGDETPQPHELHVEEPRELGRTLSGTALRQGYPIVVAVYNFLAKEKSRWLGLKWQQDGVSTAK